jgi:hypothetical protein
VTIETGAGPGTRVTVRLTRFEHLAGLLRDLDIPTGAISTVEVVANGYGSVPGWRAPGLAWPCRVKIGTWRTRGRRWFVVVRRGDPALRLTFGDGVGWAGAVVGTPEADRIAAELARILDP